MLLTHILKNKNNVLPLKKGTKVFIGGPGANNKSSLHGCWSYSWQGDEEFRYPDSTLTIKKALEKYIGKEYIISLLKSIAFILSIITINKNKTVTAPKYTPININAKNSASNKNIKITIFKTTEIKAKTL